MDPLFSAPIPIISQNWQIKNQNNWRIHENLGIIEGPAAEDVWYLIGFWICLYVDALPVLYINEKM